MLSDVGHRLLSGSFSDLGGGGRVGGGEGGRWGVCLTRCCTSRRISKEGIPRLQNGGSVTGTS